MVPPLAEASTDSAHGRRPVPGTPVRVGIVDECELVQRGLAGMLEPHRHRVHLVRTPRLRDEVGPQVDVVLYDPSLLAPQQCEEIERLARRRGARAVVFTWDPEPERPSTGAGDTPVLSKCWGAEQVVAGLEAVAEADADADAVGAPSGRPATGRRPVGGSNGPAARRPARGPRQLPGGLTEREAQIIDLISRGLSNDEVARACYLSINSIKTYIRTAYRKMGVTRRSQAVVWGLEHGLGGPQSPVGPAPGPRVPAQPGPTS
jgi:NarL family two-component system response regulator LiaR